MSVRLDIADLENSDKKDGNKYTQDLNNELNDKDKNKSIIGVNKSDSIVNEFADSLKVNQNKFDKD